MLRSINWKQSRETTEEQRAAGRYHPARVATLRDGNKRRRITLGAGDGDTVHVYREAGDILIVTIRRSLGYCGIEAYRDGESIGELFLQRDSEVAATLGRNEEDYAALDRLSDHAVARRLATHFYEVFC